MGFISTSLVKGARYYYYCAYDPGRRNVKRMCLGRVGDEGAEARVRLLKSIMAITKEYAERKRREAELDGEHGLGWWEKLRELSLSWERMGRAAG